MVRGHSRKMRVVPTRQGNSPGNDQHVGACSTQRTHVNRTFTASPPAVRSRVPPDILLLQ